jgi:hypothetical protein
VRDLDPDGNILRTNLHRDHMDPVALGGRYDPADEGGDDSDNAVWCCAPCNLRKGDMPFVDWLATLAPRFRRLARRVYVAKHGHAPEAFRPSRGDRDYMTFRIGMDDPDTG